MIQRTNDFGQPIGPALPDWRACARPSRISLSGEFCRLEPLHADQHASELYAAISEDIGYKNWTYLSRDAPTDFNHYRDWLAEMAASEDPLFYAILDQRSGAAVGIAAYLRIDPANGVIEVGHLNFSPRLQRTAAATEAMFLMMRHVFDELGYRRYEWKCDSLNAPSRITAQRLGFQYEGTFRQALVYKGRNRDSAWFSIIDRDWPAIKNAFEQWLTNDNFDASGKQRNSLSRLMQQAPTRQKE